MTFYIQHISPLGVIRLAFMQKYPSLSQFIKIFSFMQRIRRDENSTNQIMHVHAIVIIQEIYHVLANDASLLFSNRRAV